MTKDELSGADIKAVCSKLSPSQRCRVADMLAEAGLLALRERRMRVTKVVSVFEIYEKTLTHRTSPRPKRRYCTERTRTRQRDCTCKYGRQRRQYAL